MILDLILLLVGCALLYVGADRVIRHAFQLGTQMRLSPVVTGLVIVAVGTSLPELAVSVDAAIHGHGAIALGNVVGSNIVNLTLVIGAGALFASLVPRTELLERDLPLLVIITLVAAWMLLDGALGRLEGGILLVSVVGFLLYRVLHSDDRAVPIHATTREQDGGIWSAVGGLTIGLVLLIAGAEAMVASATGLAREFGVSEAVIALTVTAVATGIPEIAATLVAIRRGYTELALGNIVGSNLINLGVVLGLTGLIAPVSGAPIGLAAIVMLVAMTLFLWGLLMLLPLLNRWTGIALLALFGAYQVSVVS